MAKVGCDFCQGSFTVEEVEAFNRERLQRKESLDQEAQKARDKVRQNPQEQAQWSEDEATAQKALQSYHCQNCGAEVVTDQETVATYCYYCHSPVVLTDRLSGEFRPDSIIPFKLSKEEAKAKFLSWAKKKKLVPKAFYSQQQMEKMTGVYIPFWRGSTVSDVNYKGTGRQYRTWDSGDTRYTEEKIFAFERQGEVSSENMLEMGTDKDDRIDPKLVETISDYKQKEAVPFAMPYLSGFFADMTTLPEEEARERFLQRGEDLAHRRTVVSLGDLSKLEYEVREAPTKLVKQEYELLPTWILTFQYLKKTYVYAINGQTGTAYGELPLDRKKLLGFAGLVALAVLAALLVGGLWIW